MKICVIGQSAIAVKAFERIRVKQPQAEMILVAFDSILPVLPDRFPSLMARTISRADVIYRDEKFYQDMGITLIADKKINRINFNRKIVFFDDKDRLEYDLLIIAGSERDQFPDVKGINKESVFSLRSLAQVDQMSSILMQIDTAIIQSEGVRGIRFAGALSLQKKNVIMCLPQGRILPGLLEEDISDAIIGLLQNTGIRVLRNCLVSEILGERDVKAVRLSSGKVIAAEAVVYPDALPDIRLFHRTDLACKDMIETDSLCCTSVDDVFALDEVSEISKRLCLGLWDSEFFIEDHVSRLVAGIEKTVVESGLPQVNCHIELLGHDIDLIGQLRIENGCDRYDECDEQGNLRKCFFVKNNVVTGAVLIDNTDMRPFILQVIQQQEFSNDRMQEILAGCQRCKAVESMDIENLPIGVGKGQDFTHNSESSCESSSVERT